MAKDKRYFCLIGIGFVAKKENELHLFYCIYSIFYLIPKIYFKKYRGGGGIQINAFLIFYYVYLFIYYYYYYYYYLLLLYYFYVYFIFGFVFALLCIISCVVAFLHLKFLACYWWFWIVYTI